MKLLSFIDQGLETAGMLLGPCVYVIRELDDSLPQDMMGILEGGEAIMDRLRVFEREISQEVPETNTVASARIRSAQRALDAVQILAPVPQPASCRDAYAFRQHVATARANRGLGMIPEFDQFPVFYFTNHRSIIGPGPVRCMPAHLNRLDFELEVAVVLNRRGRNIPAHQADDYIAGYMVMNDFSARALQMEEMQLHLGPAKGKDFATALGPWLVTPDELAPYRVEGRPGQPGQVYNLEMIARVNGQQVSRGHLSDMHWTFAEIIERASYGVDLYPGDVIGSGTVGTGCFLELNGTGRLEDPDHYTEQWLQAGDHIELEVTGLGVLANQVVLEDDLVSRNLTSL